MLLLKRYVLRGIEWAVENDAALLSSCSAPRSVWRAIEWDVLGLSLRDHNVPAFVVAGRVQIASLTLKIFNVRSHNLRVLGRHYMCFHIHHPRTTGFSFDILACKCTKVLHFHQRECR